MNKIYTLAILTTLAVATVALAEPGAHGGHRQAKLERLDADKDGKITLAEMKSEAAQKFKQLDADENGRVAKEELAAHHAQMRAKWAQKKADARGDDKAAGKSHGDCHGKRHGDKAGGFLSKMDSNADGAIDAKEFDRHVEQRFARMDQNGDEVLTGAELEHRRGKHGQGRHGHERAGKGRGTAGSPAPAR